jgi:hypothetical protein
MRRRGLPLAMVVVLMGGCVRTGDPPARANAAPPSACPVGNIAKPQTDSTKSQVEKGKQHAEFGRLPAGQAGQSHDEFDLPLVIHVETPEVPPEIKNPSPPIQERPEPPAETFDPWKLFQQKPKPP